MNRRTLIATAGVLAIAGITGGHAMAQARPRRVLWAANVRNKSLDERLLAAQAGGYDAMSVFPIDFKMWRESLSAAEIRRRIAAAGIQAAIVDPFVQWTPDFEIPAAYPPENIAFINHDEDAVFAMADALGAGQINLVEGLNQSHPRAALVDALGGFVERAAARGWLTTLEPMPISSIATLAQGWDLIQAVDSPHLGLTFDTWHFWRADPDHDLLATIPGDKIFEIQLADAQSELQGDMVNDLLHHRLLPGEGDFDLARTVHVLRRIGANRSVGPELFSDAMDALPAAEVGRITGRSLSDWT